MFQMGPNSIENLHCAKFLFNIRIVSTVSVTITYFEQHFVIKVYAVLKLSVAVRMFDILGSDHLSMQTVICTSVSPRSDHPPFGTKTDKGL